MTTFLRVEGEYEPMLLVHMKSEQIKSAIIRNAPVLMAAGVVEYHGPHLPIGTDLLMANAVCEEVERRCDCVLAPPFAYGPTLGWAESPIEGDMDFAPEPFYAYAREALRCILEMGFRRIYVLQFHQGPEGLQSLCLRNAAASLIRETASRWGGGWGRKYTSELPVKNIFSMIKIATLDSFVNDAGCKMDFTHAGKGETQFMMAACPGLVDMGAMDEVTPELIAWLEDAGLANAAEGGRWLERCVQGWVRELSSAEI
jgi:creatinine amidohydrolase